MYRRALALAALALAAAALAPGGASAAPDASLPTAHIIPHSHCDPGWLDTFQGYYDKSVRRILDGVLAEMVADRSRRFVWGETSFFELWWSKLDPTRREQWKDCLERKQIEFVGGGWAQHDEANPDHVSVINQLTAGHSYLVQEFGAKHRPRVAWQIDPFGHSAITPSLFALMGYEALVINRIHHQLKAEFKRTRHMEFVWSGSDLGGGVEGRMFTHVLHTHYSAPQGFDYEGRSTPINSGNVKRQAGSLARMLLDRLKAYRTPNLLVPFGDDFKFQNARRQFENMDQLVKEIQANPKEYGLNLRYSTLSEYFEAAAAAKEVKHPLHFGDFFPYADNEDSYWTGYYTTRPFHKAATRRVEAAARGAEVMNALAPVPADDFGKLVDARRQAALFLHHDAITGTCRETVSRDYMTRMNRAEDELMATVERGLSKVLSLGSGADGPSLARQAYTLTAMDTKVYPIVLFNSLGWPRREVFSVRVATPHAAVYNSQGHEVAAQLDAFFGANDAREPQPSEYTLSWVGRVPALGAATYFVRVRTKPIAAKRSMLFRTTTVVYEEGGPAGASPREAESGSTLVEYARAAPSGEGSRASLHNGLLKATFDTTTGLLEQLTLRGPDDPEVAEAEARAAAAAAAAAADAAGHDGRPADREARDAAEGGGGGGGKARAPARHQREWEDRDTDVAVDMRQRFHEYATRRGGAYLFRPQGGRNDVKASAKVVRVTRGRVVSKVAYKYGEYDVEAVLAGGERNALAGHLEVRASVNAKPNTNVVVRFESSLSGAGDQFETHDSLEFMRRTRKGSPMQANFYPMVYGARMTDLDQGLRLSVANAHTTSVSSQSPGEMEIVLHRFLNQDDGRGLAEPVRDSNRAEVTLRLCLEAVPARDRHYYENNKAKHARFYMDADLAFTHRALRLNNPARAFFPQGDALSGDNDPATWAHWLQTNVPELGAEARAKYAAALSEEEIEVGQVTDLSHEALHKLGVKMGHAQLIKDAAARVADVPGEVGQELTPRSYGRKFRTHYSPLKSALPEGVHLHSLRRDDNGKKEVALRLMSLTPQATFDRDWSELFASAPTEARAATLSLHSSLPIGEYLSRSLHFAHDDDNEAVHNTAELPAELDDRANQNTEEAGVFLSDDALRLADRASDQAPDAGMARRRLLAAADEDCLGEDEEEPAASGDARLVVQGLQLRTFRLGFDTHHMHRERCHAAAAEPVYGPAGGGPGQGARQPPSWDRMDWEEAGAPADEPGERAAGGARPHHYVRHVHHNHVVLPTEYFVASGVLLLIGVLATMRFMQRDQTQRLRSE